MTYYIMFEAIILILQVVMISICNIFIYLMIKEDIPFNAINGPNIKAIV